jgi:nicotinamidase-related amidase
MQLVAKTSALILIDLQRGVLAMPLAPHSAATVYERSMRLADRFCAASGLVVRLPVSFSRDLADAPRSPVDQPMKYEALPPGWDEFPEPPDPSDLVITKRHWGAFHCCCVVPHGDLWPPSVVSYASRPRRRSHPLSGHQPRGPRLRRYHRRLFTAG